MRGKLKLVLAAGGTAAAVALWVAAARATTWPINRYLVDDYGTPGLFNGATAGGVYGTCTNTADGTGSSPTLCSDDTTLDTVTGLTWMRESTYVAYKWRDAYRYCEDLTLQGHTDWRLPNAKEILTLWDDGSNWMDAYAFLVSPRPSGGSSFCQFSGTTFWSSTPSPVNPSVAWFTCWTCGGGPQGAQVFLASVNDLRCVRCVRGPVAP